VHSSDNKRSFKNFSVIKHDTYYEIEVFENGEFGFEDLKLQLEAQKEMGGQHLPVLVLCGDYTTTDVDFMNHLSKNVNVPYSAADAFVINSLPQRIIANFYVMIMRPERPTKFFNSKEEAVKWMKKLKY
jgi:hypothetical protein